ncbi:MAG: hypothetical protein GY778_00710 [bacterium]|nr:hypothetical protein [bacterium]
MSILTEHRGLLDQPAVDDGDRKRLLDSLGAAFGEYRATVYERGFAGRATVPTQAAIDLFRIAREYADHSLQASRRPSGLYHSYNLIHFEKDGREISIDHLPEMLEGQVAAISSGALSSGEVLALVEALFASPLYRPDQRSFLLYPARELPAFLAKNVISKELVETTPLLAALIGAGDASLVVRDASGSYRFAPDLGSGSDLAAALDRLNETPDWMDLVAAHREAVQEAYETVFRHKSFTGRSGSMYKYEGLGSIYWHMVAKLALAVQESFWLARSVGEPADVTRKLADAYYRIRGGLSSDKSPTEYGAFPMDPYSHTPGHLGAQQPGMTGQVKEEMLARWGELGLRVGDGTISFDPVLLRRREFLTTDRDWVFTGLDGREQAILLPAQSLGFTFCQVPVVYRLAEGPTSVTVVNVSGDESTAAGVSLDQETSRAVFDRRGTVARVEASLAPSAIGRD